VSWTLAGSKKVGSASTTGPISATFTEAVASGDLVIATVNAYGGFGGGAATVSDNQSGNTWHQRARSAVSYASWAQLSDCIVTTGAGAGGFAVSASFGSATTPSMAVLHYTNAAGTISFDTATAAVGNSTTAGAASLTLASTAELVVATAAIGLTAVTYTPSTGFAAEQSSTSLTGQSPFCAVDDVAGLSGTITPSVGLSTTARWAWCVAAYQVSGAVQDPVGVASDTSTLCMAGP
jgi:hypothetical protein